MDADDLEAENEEEKEVRMLLRDVFGESSAEDDDDDDWEDPKTNTGGIPNWETISEINGLWICPDFLSPHQQSSLLSSIHKEGWLSDSSRNQAMRFGDLPSWAVELSNSIRESVCLSNYISEPEAVAAGGEEDSKELDPSAFPSDLIWREPLFDQLIMNTYEPGEGICAHVDLMRFEDGIAIVSLESPCIMHFTPETGGDDDDDDELPPGNHCSRKVPVYLSEGSLVLMAGEARYQWKHEINRKPGFQIWKGREIEQRKRTSVTLRKLCPASGS